MVENVSLTIPKKQDSNASVQSNSLDHSVKERRRAQLDGLVLYQVRVLFGFTVFINDFRPVSAV